MIIHCAECGKQISDKAAACPSCGAPVAPFSPPKQTPPPPPTPRVPWYFNLWLVTAALIIFPPLGLILMWLSGRWPLWLRIVPTVLVGLIFINAVTDDDSSSKEATSNSKSIPTKRGSTAPSRKSEPSYIELRGSVINWIDMLEIENKDNFHWTNVELIINLGVSGGGYVRKVSKINSRDTISLAVIDFVKTDGTRFNPATTMILKLAITCDTLKGQGRFFESWQ